MKKKKNNLTIKMSLLLLCMFSALQILGCASEKKNVETTENTVADYKIGVIYSTGYAEKSYIDFWNTDGKCVDTKAYNYGDIIPTGFSNSVQNDNILYVCPLGKDTERECGIILGIDMKQTTSMEYDLNRTNITSFVYDSGNLYASSNINGVNYVDRYVLKSGTISSLECEDKAIDALCGMEGMLYGFDEDFNTEEIYLCKFDFDKKEEISLLKLDNNFEEAPSFLAAWNHFLYFTDGTSLYSYDLENDKVDSFRLVHSNGFNLKIQDDKLYVGCTDIFSDEASYIDIYDLNNNTLLGSIPYDGAVMQMEIENDKIYVSDLNVIDVFQLKDDFEASKTKTINMVDGMDTSEDYYVSGFFVKE